MIEKLTRTKAAEPLFQGWQETLIWSCLDGIMGGIYADDTEHPSSAMAILGDFCFLAGEPKREMVLYKPKGCSRNFMIMVPQQAAWADLIEECCKDRAKKVTRYAIKKEPGVFDREKLRRIAESLPPGYRLSEIDEELFYRCRGEAWSRDLVSQYADFAQYRRLGLGAVVLREGIPVSGASSYARYSGGIEIEIDTREDCRRKGLASACGALLILNCLERRLYPSWDAQNLWSVGLAEKLGYHFDREYPAYEIWGD